MVLTGFPHLLRHSQRPVTAGALVVAGVGALAATSLVGPRPPRVLAVATTVGAVAAGGVIAVLNGPEPMVGDKLGIMLMVWSCMLLTAARPECRWIAVGLAVVPLAVCGPLDVIFGALCAVIVVMCSLVAARLVSALTDLGSEADRDRHRAAASDRRSAARLLHRQAAVISDAATTTTPATDQLADRLVAVGKQAEHYLRPPRECLLGVGLQARLGALPDFGDRLDLDTTQLNADLAPGTVRSIVAAVTEIASTLLRVASIRRVSVRAVGEATRWQLSLLVELADAGSAAETPPVVSARVGANLATAGIAVTIWVMPGGDHYVELRPMGPGTAAGGLGSAVKPRSTRTSLLAAAVNLARLAVLNLVALAPSRGGRLPSCPDPALFGTSHLAWADAMIRPRFRPPAGRMSACPGGGWRWLAGVTGGRAPCYSRPRVRSFEPTRS
jgi:hypothetical protein